MGEFHKSEEEPDFPGGPVKIAVDDNTKLSAQDYRNPTCRSQQIKREGEGARGQGRGARARAPRARRSRRGGAGRLHGLQRSVRPASPRRPVVVYPQVPQGECPALLASASY